MYQLQDGDVLVLRYTLAYQRDVSSADQENAFCVSMLNGSMNISHKWQTVTGADGAEQTVCTSCGKLRAFESTKKKHLFYE